MSVDSQILKRRTKPSRLKCIWLIENNEQLDFWKKTLTSQKEEYQILEVSISGNSHRANQSFLSNDSESFDLSLEKARKYWRGKDTGGCTTELLLEGKMEVINILKD